MKSERARGVIESAVPSQVPPENSQGERLTFNIPPFKPFEFFLPDEHIFYIKIKKNKIKFIMT
jgi:hypothetical protein